MSVSARLSLRDRAAAIEAGRTTTGSSAAPASGGALASKLGRTPRAPSTVGSARYAASAASDDGSELSAAKAEITRLKDQLRQVDSRWEAEMMQLVGQLEAAQQQLQQQLRAPGGAGDPAELDQLRRQLADEAEDNDELSKQIVALDSDHQKLQEQAAAITEENRVFREENERLLKLNAALKERASMAEGGHSEAGQDATVLHQQLEAAGTRLEELVEENEDLQIKCKELELRETTLQETLDSKGQLIVEGTGVVESAEIARLRKSLEVADVEKERLVDEVEEKEIRNTELLIEIETLEEEILQLDERLLQMTKAQSGGA